MSHRSSRSRRLARSARLLTPLVVMAGIPLALPAHASSAQSAHDKQSAVEVYNDDVRPLGTVGGVRTTGGGYGSSLTPKPGNSNELYGLTDRGPNVTGPDGNQVEPLPDFVPACSGRVNSANPTGETIEDMAGHALPQDPNGYDSEGLVAMTDGTFWVSDAGAVHEYLYLLHDPATTGTANSEITALSDTTFLVDERDGKVATPTAPAFKRLYKIDLTGATDVGPHTTVPGATYAPTEGLTLGGKSIEALTVGEDTAASEATLSNAGIHVVSSTLDVDIDAVLAAVDPSRTLFPHDKMEGVAALDGGRTLVISNDSDFGISSAISAAGNGATTAPYELIAKDNPLTGQQDDGQLLVIHTGRVPGA